MNNSAENDLAAVERYGLPGNENQAVQEFLTEPSHLKFDTWYALQICQYLLFLAENKAKYVAIVFQDGLEFERQLESLLMICRTIQKNGFFICKEPGNNFHYICGLYANNWLLLINPMGITAHKNFYTTIAKAKDKTYLEKIYLSAPKMQRESYEKSGIVSCGAIVAELGMHLLNKDGKELEEFFKHIVDSAKSMSKEDLDYYLLEDLDQLLPETLSSLLKCSSENDYRNKVLSIRRWHLDKLKKLPQQAANSKDLSGINQYLGKLKDGSNAQKLFNKISLENKFTMVNLANEEEYKLLGLELNNPDTYQYVPSLTNSTVLAQSNLPAAHESMVASIRTVENLVDLFPILTNIADTKYATKICDTWATSFGINQALEHRLKYKGEYLVHIINTELSSVESLVSSEEGAINYVEKIVGYQDSDGEMHETGYIHKDGGVLKKPVVMIVNTNVAVATSKLDVLAEGGTHWQCCVILPKKYKPKFADRLNNEIEIVFYLDSLNPGVGTPAIFKRILTEGTSYTFSSDKSKSGEEIIHTVTHKIPALCEKMEFIDGLTTNQQLGDSDCGWWALYNVLMIVFTGRVDYLAQFKSPSRESAYRLRAMFLELDKEPPEQINRTGGTKLDSDVGIYDHMQIDDDFNHVLDETDIISASLHFTPSIPISGAIMPKVASQEDKITAQLDKDGDNELIMFNSCKKQDFSGNIVVSENGFYLAVVQDFEDGTEIQVFALNKNDGQRLVEPSVNLVETFNINSKNISKVKISNDGHFLFYIETVTLSDNTIRENLFSLNLCSNLSIPTEIPFEEFVGQVFSDYIISPNGHFIALKFITTYILTPNFNLIFPESTIVDVQIVDVLERKRIGDIIRCCSGLSFISDDTIIHLQNGSLEKLSLSKLKAQNEDYNEILLNRQNSNDFLANMSPTNLWVVHPNKSRLLFFVNEGIDPGVLFYDINSNNFNWATIPYLRSASKISYLSGERLLCVIESVSFVREQPKKYKLAILDLKDGKAKRPIYLQCPLENFDYIGVHPTLMFAAVSSGKHVCYINLPCPSKEAKQYFFQHNDLIVPGEQLLKLGYKAFNSILQAATQQPQTILTKGAFSSNMLKIQSGKHWLLTAGHLSKYPTSIDKRLEKWFPVNVEVFDSKHYINITEIRGDAFVKFPNSDGSYISISQYLHKMTEIELPSFEIEKIISCLLNNQVIDNNNPPKHSDIAKTLLSRLAGGQYPTDYTSEQKIFFDCLLVLMFGVEGSRNNLTFLTGVMLLDLIASNSFYGRKGHQYNWNNAFVSGPQFNWNDFENKDYGGKFPMATNSTGSGNMTQRRELISNGQPDGFRDFQRERVQIREMSIISHWLQAFSRKEPDYFSSISSLSEIQDKILNLFEKRLREVFLEEPILDSLPYNQPNSGGHSSLKRHYKDEPFVYYLRHRASGKSELKEDEYYHRTDHPCKTVPGFVLHGKAKDVTALKSQITAELSIVKKELTYITKTNLQFTRFLKENTTNILDYNLKGKICKIIVDYNKWLICYFNPEVFGFIENSTFNSVLAGGKFTYFGSDFAKSILEKLKWDMGTSNTEGRISREQIIRLIESISLEKKYNFLKTNSDLNSYVDRFIKALQSVLDPLIDLDKSKLLVNLSISMPEEYERIGKINQLMVSAGINFTAENENQINSILNALLGWDPFFCFDVGFDIKQKPCHACYSQYSEPYPSLPYNHDNVVCLYNDDHPFYHRIDSSCKTISYEENKHVFREEPKEPHIEVLEPYEKKFINLRPGTYILQRSNDEAHMLDEQNVKYGKWSIFYIDRNLNDHTLRVEEIEGLNEELSTVYISASSQSLKNIIQSYHTKKYVFLELKSKFVYEARYSGKKPCESCWWELRPSSKSDIALGTLNKQSKKRMQISGRTGCIRDEKIKKPKIQDNQNSLALVEEKEINRGLNNIEDSRPIFTPGYSQIKRELPMFNEELEDSSIEVKRRKKMQPD